MQFGLFGGAQADRPGGGAMGQGFHDFVEFNIEAEALGYRGTFLVEHHFSGWNQVSATLTLLTFLAARTRTLRLGSAVMVLPWHNPVVLAEQAATLDLMSDGRLDFGVGKGYRHNEFRGFAVPPAEADARFDEALDIILKAWTSPARFSHRGTYWQFDDIMVEPPTAQKPHPPIWMAAGSAASIRRVAERGCNLILDQFAPVALTGERLALFRTEVEKRGRRFDPTAVAVARDLYVAKDRADKEAALARNLKGHERILSVARSPERAGGSHILAYSHSLAAAEAASLVGTPDEIAEKLDKLRALGVEYLILSMNGARDSLRRFARDIMPAFANSVMPAQAGIQ
jgi:alkanesulfonate monooxygenase SsuD/methylene tetrahydromethanopterin reductase-like flavin-dependent oxidoreductase (luciferase family)